MKIFKTIIVSVFLTSALALTACQSTQNDSQNQSSLQGTYAGVLPCASCEGIETQISFLANGSYSKIETYLGEGSQFIESGAVSWDASRSILTLKDKSSTTQYKLIADGLLLLDAEGNVPEGRLAGKYILKKL